LQGPIGATGPAGPTSASFAYQDVTIPVAETSTPVLDLASLNTVGDSQITTSFDAIIMASATLVFQTGFDNANLFCHLDISDGTGPTNGFTTMSTAFGTALSVFGSDPDFPYLLTLPLIGAKRVTPGTYNVRARCYANFGLPEGCGCPDFELPQFKSGYLNVWATAPSCNPSGGRPC
jgi:hypothetical protein